MKKITGNQLFVKALIAEGVDHIFAYPGGYAIDVFDALYKAEPDTDIEIVLPRHEQGLIHEADGYARSTGNVGVCLVTSGPGATNLVTGIATANYDSVPIVCFTGQVSLPLIGNDAFQEVDIVGCTRNIAKWVITVRDRKDLGRIIKEAFYIARTGKPGVVVVDLPKDVMATLGDDHYPEEVSIRGYKPNKNVNIRQLNRAVGMLYKAKNPLFLVGGGVKIANAHKEMRKFAEITGVPVVSTVMGIGVMPTDHPLFMGNAGMHGRYSANMAISECDVLFSIGTRFSDRITGELGAFAPNAKIIHIDIDTAAISKNVTVNVPIVGDAKIALTELVEIVKDKEPVATAGAFADRIREWNKECPLTLPASEKGVNPQKIFETANELLKDAIVVTDVGQHQMWATQFTTMESETRQFITSGGLGTMGFGIPAAIGACMGNRDTKVVCFSGDGGAQMNIQEMATAVQEETPIIICILNNQYLGMVRQMQDLFYDRRFASTCLCRRRSCQYTCKGPGPDCPPYTPDFVKLAESYGAKGIRVTNEDQIAPAFEAAMKEDKLPTIIEFMIDADRLVLPMVQSGKALDDMILEG
ncbi:MAG: biosynthetic-type acetolactate synthase large subunit [Lachnospiraceae bacterium]|nr:biosynthetic-type acetolactate synthase large subunit [Lachnospiraceae bacterium]